MNGQGGRLLRRLLWPELAPVEAGERSRAAERITQAQHAELLTEDQAERRRSIAATARTRADLLVALHELPGVPSTTLFRVRRVVTAVWLVACLAELTTWGLIWILGQNLASPWWLWTVLGGGLIVGGLSWATAFGYRTFSKAEVESPRT